MLRASNKNYLFSPRSLAFGCMAAERHFHFQRIVLSYRDVVGLARSQYHASFVFGGHFTKSGWNSLYLLSPQALVVSTIREAEATRIINTMKSCGIPMQPFTWERSLPLDEQVALLEICLEVGGGPNFTRSQDPSESFILSEPPLLIALRLLGNGEYNNNSVPSGIRMLTLLIGAGANIYHIVQCRFLMPLPIAFWAYSLGSGDRLETNVA